LFIDRSVGRWIGTALALVAVAATIWLAAADKLSLYIHPRYTLFTVLLASLAGLAAVAAIVAGSGEDHGHGHHDPEDGHDHVAGRPPALSLWGRLNRWLVLVVLVGAIVGMLVLPPSTLSATARQNRTLVTSGHALDATNTTALVGGNSATFTVKDWAALLREGGAGAVLGRKADLTGYVLAQGDDNTFFVTRLLVSCCAVDSQPVGVPVYLPNWRDQLAAGGWIAVKGTFVDESERETRFPTAIKISTIKKIDEPSQPYVF
jgi:uncharacterized repeat protein (TIGR03943 family)